MKHNPFLLAYVRYRFGRRLVRYYQNFLLTLLAIRYRFLRRLFYRYHNLVTYLLSVRYRFLKKLRFRTIRLMVFFMWRLWVKEVSGFEHIPEREAAIIVSNHQSYYDFFVLASVLKKQTVFVAMKSLNQRSFVGWFMKLDTIIYVDREKPGYEFFKELMRQLNHRKLVVLYPEGMRSRSGKMLEPKTGFIKIAIKTNSPIIPIATKGTYEILPPHRRFPSLKKCEVHIGEKIYISPATPFLKDIFFRRKGRRKFGQLNDDELSEIAFRIMDRIRKVSGQEWDESAIEKANQYGLADDAVDRKTIISNTKILSEA